MREWNIKNVTIIVFFVSKCVDTQIIEKRKASSFPWCLLKIEREFMTKLKHKRLSKMRDWSLSYPPLLGLGKLSCKRKTTFSTKCWMSPVSGPLTKTIQSWVKPSDVTFFLSWARWPSSSFTCTVHWMETDRDKQRQTLLHKRRLGMLWIMKYKCRGEALEWVRRRNRNQLRRFLFRVERWSFSFLHESNIKMLMVVQPSTNVILNLRTHTQWAMCQPPSNLNDTIYCIFLFRSAKICGHVAKL